MKKPIPPKLPLSGLCDFVSSWFQRKQSEPQISADFRRWIAQQFGADSSALSGALPIASRPAQSSFAPSCLGWVIFLAVATLGNLVTNAQEEESANQGPTSDVLVPEAYTFQMRLKPNVDINVEVAALSTKNSKGRSESDELIPEQKIQRQIRELFVFTRVQIDGTETVRYYAKNWCAFDDPRKGINVVRSNIGGVEFPMNDYHFPELIWAEPKTKQAILPKKDGEQNIQLYKDGDRLLEVDATTLRPLRYVDGILEWKYSYKESSTPIVIPEKLKASFARVLPKQTP